MTLYFEGVGIELQDYVNLELAGGMDGRMSTTDYIFTLGSVTISWVSRIHKTITLSITEEKYIAMTESNKEMNRLQNFLAELGKE